LGEKRWGKPGTRFKQPGGKRDVFGGRPNGCDVKRNIRNPLKGDPKVNKKRTRSEPETTDIQGGVVKGGGGGGGTHRKNKQVQYSIRERQLPKGWLERAKKGKTGMSKGNPMGAPRGAI